MRKFLVKLFLSFALIYSILFLLQFTLDIVLDTKNICDNSWNKIFNGNINSDIIIIGNSRAEAHYNPKIIEGITKHSTYNLGLSGTPLNIFKIRWKSFINRNLLPKLLIIDVDSNILGTSNELYEKFQYLPYTCKKEYQEVAKNIDKDYYYEKIIPIYKYRGYEMQILNKLKETGDTICENMNKGFKPQAKIWDDTNWTNFSKRIAKENKDKKEFKFRYSNGINELNNIIAFCKTNDIQVLLVWSPNYYKMLDYKKELKTYLDSVFKSIAKKNKLVYINFYNDSICYDKVNFYEKSHLNLQGANLFSKKISDSLNNIFFTK